MSATSDAWLEAVSLEPARSRGIKGFRSGRGKEDRDGWEIGSPISEACNSKPVASTGQCGFAKGNSALRKLSITSFLADQSQM